MSCQGLPINHLQRTPIVQLPTTPMGQQTTTWLISRPDGHPALLQSLQRIQNDLPTEVFVETAGVEAQADRPPPPPLGR